MLDTRTKKRQKEYKPRPHPREEDINRAQPHSIKSMGGVGNGQERKHGFGRGS